MFLFLIFFLRLSNVQTGECTLSKSEGDCKAKQANWYFDTAENRCMPFYYSGCGGNENNFAYYEHCLEYCPAKIGKVYEPTFDVFLINFRLLILFPVLI